VVAVAVATDRAAAVIVAADRSPQQSVAFAMSRNFSRFAKRRLPFAMRWAVRFALIFPLVVASWSVAFAQNPAGEAIDAPASDTAVSALPKFRPILQTGMTAADQRKAIGAILGNLEPDRFFNRSVVSPFVFQLEPISKLADGGNRQRLDVYFVAYGKLADIDPKKMMDDFTGPETPKTPGLPDVARALTEKEMNDRGLAFGDQPDGSGRSFGILGANILDKVFVTGITGTRYRKTDDSIELHLELAPTLVEDQAFPARWHPISRSGDGTFQLSPGNPYADLSAMIKATKLADVDDAVFIEVHVVYAEPQGWFEGRNLLRSKLPPVLQDAVRKFRRKLAQ